MRINKSVRKGIGMLAMLIALGTAMQIVRDVRVYRIYDPEMVADLVWAGISIYGVLWGFRDRPEIPKVGEEVRGSLSGERREE